MIEEVAPSSALPNNISSSRKIIDPIPERPGVTEDILSCTSLEYALKVSLVNGRGPIKLISPAQNI